MSRIGLKEVVIPAGVEITIKDGGNYEYKVVTVKGPKGELTESLRRGISIEIDNGILKVSRDNETKMNKSFHGLYRSLINNMVIGVTEGYETKLEIVGIGYRAEAQGNKVVFSLGYSHKKEITPPANTLITVEEQTKIKVSGIDKQVVGEIAAKIRSFRAPEPYKGKGVRYAGEIIKKKSAKTVGK